MRDNNQRPLCTVFRIDDIFQNGNSGNIQMVCRFVQKKQIRFQGEGERQRGSFFFTAACERRIALWIEIKFRETLIKFGDQPPAVPFIFKLMNAAPDDQTVFKSVCIRQQRFLFYVVNAKTVLNSQFSVVQLDSPG